MNDKRRSAFLGLAVVAAIACGILTFQFRRYEDIEPEFSMKRTQGALVSMGQGLHDYKIARGYYPDDARNLTSKYLRAVPRDGWGGDLMYHPRSADGMRPFVLYSFGRNQIDERGRGDDIDFWSEEVQRWYARASR